MAKPTAQDIEAIYRVLDSCVRGSGHPDPLNSTEEDEAYRVLDELKVKTFRWTGVV